MPSLPTRQASAFSPAYSRDATIAAITSFYRTFATHPFVRPSASRLPPPTGWPSIPATELRQRGKDDEVIESSRHSPYLDSDDGGGEMWTISDETVCIPYHRGVCYREDVEAVGRSPGHVVPIAEAEGREGGFLLVDIRPGTITHYQILEGNSTDYDRYDASPEADKWTAFPTAPVRDFFDRWSRSYEKLVWMVAPHPMRSEYHGMFFSRAERVKEEDELLASDEDDEGGSGMEDPETKEVYAIYKRHGWPSDFRREQCRSELSAFSRASAGV